MRKYLYGIVFPLSACLITGAIFAASSLQAHDTTVYGPIIPYETVKDSPGCTAMGRNATHLFTVGNGILSVYEIAENPASPRLVGQVKSLLGGRQLAVAGNILYITARNYGLWIVDVSKPEDPKVLNRYDTIELATGIAVSSDVAFVALRVYGVQVLNISDRARPKHVTLLRTDEAQSVFSFGKHIAIGDWHSGRVVFADVSDPRNPTIRSTVDLDGFGDGVDMQGNFCYAATGHHAKTGPKEERHGRGHGLDVFDISNLDAPVKTGGVKFPEYYQASNDFWTPRASGDTVFVVDTHNGLFMVDATDKHELKITGHLELPKVWRRTETRETIEVADCAASLVLGDGVVYIAGQKTGLHVAKVPGKSRYVPAEAISLTVPPAEPVAEIPGLKRFDLGNVRRIAVDGDRAYVACSHDGIRLLRLSEDGITPIRSWKKQCSYDVAIKDGKLYSAEDSGNLVIYRIEKDGDLRELGRYEPPTGAPIQIVHPTVDGRFTVCSGGEARIDFIDVSDPSKPVRALQYWQPAIQYSDSIPQHDLAGRIPINWHHRGFSWHDMSGEKPKLLEEQSKADVANQLSGITIFKDQFLIPGQKNRIFLLDPRDCGAEGLTHPVTVDGPRLIGVPSWDGKDMVVFSCRRNGTVSAYRETEPGQFEFQPDRSYDISAGIPGRVVFWQDRMLIPGGPSGLFLEISKQ